MSLKDLLLIDFTLLRPFINYGILFFKVASLPVFIICIYWSFFGNINAIGKLFVACFLAVAFNGFFVKTVDFGFDISSELLKIRSKENQFSKLWKKSLTNVNSSKAKSKSYLNRISDSFKLIMDTDNLLIQVINLLIMAAFLFSSLIFSLVYYFTQVCIYFIAIFHLFPFYSVPINKTLTSILVCAFVPVIDSVIIIAISYFYNDLGTGFINNISNSLLILISAILILTSFKISMYIVYRSNSIDFAGEMSSRFSQAIGTVASLAVGTTAGFVAGRSVGKVKQLAGFGLNRGTNLLNSKLNTSPNRTRSKSKPFDPIGSSVNFLKSSIGSMDEKINQNSRDTILNKKGELAQHINKGRKSENRIEKDSIPDKATFSNKEARKFLNQKKIDPDFKYKDNKNPYMPPKQIPEFKKVKRIGSEIKRSIF